ncbi:SDR family NAD(P)-dependent oxidoreductase [Aeromicrobium fastidiosum]|uniref:SDR family oxidoreductase n=1 Tax=Aeromicrobium fastidiosum TaxID=52699 RepID=A0A641ARS4_9ACTN|nr:SDR family oxidoreductase [Aeromicrobium fastidiosum]KAA1379913.1 SDR family oxidoreductase [Aeromicrobium fastidiosum]MBP2389419.1 NAD(P)-dependent dehydrogenase (short-subunit alcohol dehydrogenase family) [Aeromicrobium fastidiosum]
MIDLATINRPVAVVTGGGRGIGAATAEALAGAGFCVAVVARSEQQIDEVAARITSTGGTAIAVAVDATDAAAVARAAALIADRLGPVDVLVNAAGGRFPENIGPLWLSPPETWWSEIAVNLQSAFLFSHAVLPSMVERGSGCIVNVGSYFGYQPKAYRSAYSAAKAAVHTMTEVLATEVAEHGVTAFTLDPAMVKTTLLLDSAASDQAARWTPEATDLPEDGYTPAAAVGDFVVRLVLGAADGMSGRVVRVHSDLEAMDERSEEIRRDEHYVLRMTKAPGIVESDPSDLYR